MFKFSVGKVTIKEGDTILKTITPLTDVEFRYSTSRERKTDAEGNVTDEFETTKTYEITISYATSDDIDLQTLEDKTLDLYFETVNGERGMDFTFASCTVSDYSYRQAQDQFTIVTITFSKQGPLDSTPGEEPVRQKVYFGETGNWVQIGDSAYIVPSYTGNAQSLIIPTALGVLIRSTATLGGGALTITVRAYVSKDTRLELEQYCLNLFSQLSTGKKSLRVEYGGSSYTISDCYWVDASVSSENKLYTELTLKFIKSAY